MAHKSTMTREDFLVDLTLHNFSAATLREFAMKIVKPYFNGNINQALRTLMEKTLDEESLYNEITIKAKTKLKIDL